MGPKFWRGLKNAVIPSLLLWGLIISGFISFAHAQSGGSTTRPTWFDGATQYYVSTAHPLPVNASVSVSASISPFTPGLSGARGTPLTVTTADSSGNLPTNTGAVVVGNVGANPMYCNVNGVAATTSDQYISSAGGWFNFGIPTGITTLHCIATGGSTTANTVGGAGLATGTGGGGGAGGSSAITTWGGATLGAATAWGTAPSGNVNGVNANLLTVPSGAYLAGSYAAGALSAGAFASGAGVDGWDLTQGAKADALCTVPTSTTACSVISLLKALTNVANSAIPAGEAHVGEIGSNQIKVQVAQTVTASLAYASGNAIGGKMTIAGAARVSGSLGAAGTGGILTGLMMNSKSLQTTQVDVFLFDADPSGSTCTDKTAFSLATADFDKVIGVVTIPGTAANGAGWYAGTVGSAGVAAYYPVTYDLASATSIYACAVTRGTPTYTATTDVSFKFNILRN